MKPHSDAEILRAATEGRRLQILELIWDQELNVSAIASQLPVSVPAVSQHLAKLRQAGLVSSRSEGRKRFYRAEKGELGPVREILEALWAKDASASEASVAAPLPPAPPPTPSVAPSSRLSPPVTLDAPVPADRQNLQREELDEMAPWYRQGLRARIVALEGARTALAEDPGAVESVRRIARSLTRPAIAELFPEIGATARTVAEIADHEANEAIDRLLGAIRQATVHDESGVVKILIVEDSRVEALLHRSIVGGPNREILPAETAEAAQAILDTETIDIILLDLTLPGVDGRDLLIGLGRRPRTASIPVILLTGRTDVQTQTEAMALGADAFYTKPVEPALLAAAVSMMLERSAEVRQLGHLDPLTGLRNRAVFLADVRQFAASGHRSEVSLSLAVIDLDRLAAINDFHGSEVGDQVLRNMADALGRAFRDSDMVARWGGGKFAVLFADTDPDGAARALQKLRALTTENPVHLPDGTSVTASWHAGIATIGGPDTLDDAVARATRRLQIAARSTRDRIVSADAAAVTGVRTVLVLEDDRILSGLIRHRLTREGFQVVHFADGAEALGELANVDASAVVLDTMLPGAEGFEVLRRMKESPSFAGVPVIVLTFGDEHDAARAFKLGASDSLAKPFAVEELVARVARLVADFEETQP